MQQRGSAEACLPKLKYMIGYDACVCKQNHASCQPSYAYHMHISTVVHIHCAALKCEEQI
jgi:hypothetical protein